MAVWFLAWEFQPEWRNFLRNGAIAVGLVGVYPLTYFAYSSFYGQTHKKLLNTDFWLLGLVGDAEGIETINELYRTVYNQTQFLIYISLIIIQSLLILTGYLNKDQLDFVSPETMTLIFYGYLGTSFFATQQVVRRFSTFDLQPQVYSAIAVRIFMATIIIYVGTSIINLSGEQLAVNQGGSTNAMQTPQTWAALLAFVIGAFPERGIRWFQQLTNRILSTTLDQTDKYPLRNIVGISPWHEARLAEMGIDDAQNLATVDIRKLLLTTRFDTQQIIHWIDQAILYVKVGPKIDRFRDAKIATFYDFRLAINKLSQGIEIEQDNEIHSERKESQNSLATILGITNQDELERLSDSSSFPNYTHIAEYYLRKALVVRQQAATGMEIVVGDIEDTNYKRAIKNAKNLLRDNPHNPKVLTNLGVAYYKLAQQQKKDSDREYALHQADLAYTAAIKYDSRMAKAYYSRSMIYMDRGNYDKAMQDCTRAIEVDPIHALAFNNRGLAQMHLGYLDRAIADFNQALKLDNHLADAYFNRAFTFSQLGSTDAALKDFERADLLGYRKHGLFWLRWGETFWKIGQWMEAIEKLSNSVLHDHPELRLAFARRGNTYLQLGKQSHKQARRDLEQAIADISEDKNSYSWLADAFEDLGILEAREKRYSEAICCLRKALEINESKYLASYHLTKIYEETNQIEAFQQELQRLIKIAPEGSPEALGASLWVRKEKKEDSIDEKSI